jgi:hypothetical protein
VVTTAAWAVVLNIKPEQSIITFFHFNVNWSIYYYLNKKYLMDKLSA